MPGVPVAAGGSPALNSGVNLFPEGLAGMLRQRKREKRVRLMLPLLRGPGPAVSAASAWLVASEAHEWRSHWFVCTLYFTVKVPSWAHGGDAHSVCPCSGRVTLGSVSGSELCLTHWTVHSCVLAVDSRLLPFSP